MNFVNLVTAVNDVNNIGQDIGDGIKDITGIITSIANPLGILAIVIMGIMLVMASDPSSIKKIKSWLIALIIGLIAINLAEPIVNAIQQIGA